MHKRALLTAIAGGFVAATGVFVACSSVPASTAAGPDAGLDVVTVFETAPPLDTTRPTFDTGVPDVVIRDAAVDRGSVRDANASEAHVTDAKVAACSLVTGACDIVSQNCSMGSECVLTEAPNGSVTTMCSPDQATEKLAKGAACCPSLDGINPCDPGLECNGGNLCATGDAGPAGAGVPAGWGGSRCTPRCCPSDGGPNTANCGTAGDGGTAGTCDFQIAFSASGPVEYTVCSYPQQCQPLRGRQCLAGFGCEVASADGGSSCQIIFNPNGDAGAGEGQACMYSNSCADGLVCLGGADASVACQWICHVAGSPTPFDAAVLQATPGYGGCPAMEACAGVQGFPDWLGACVK